jgi:hypothetical protein
MSVSSVKLLFKHVILNCTSEYKSCRSLFVCVFCLNSQYHRMSKGTDSVSLYTIKNTEFLLEARDEISCLVNKMRNKIII